MRKRLSQKFEHWRTLPEHARSRIATRLTWGAGALVVVVWLTALLPLQLYVNRPHVPKPAVEGAETSAPPSESPTPNSEQ